MARYRAIGGGIIFEEQTAVNQIKGSFEELASYLYRSQTFPHGAVLLTGTGIVPGDDFTLQPDDTVRVEVNYGVHYEDNLVSVGLHSIPIFLEDPLRFPFLPYLSIRGHQFDVPYIRI